MGKKFMKGCEAIAEAAIQAGCNLYFGYPITPQTELSEYMAARLPKIGGVFLQAESEVAAIHMIYGAAGTATRALTSSSSPGISLKQEGVSCCAAAELPVVFVNVMRAGPGTGTIIASQTDYFQATRGGGNGGYRTLTLSPSSVQEACDFIQLAFDLSEKYRQPILLLCDAIISQMMEPVDIKVPVRKTYDISWAARGWDPASGRERAKIIVRNKPGIETRQVEKYDRMRKEETRWEEYNLDDAEYVIAAYGAVARIVKNSIAALEKKGIKVGLIRPITLFPFPYEAFERCAQRESVKKFVSVEISEGQMIEDVKLGVNGKKPVELKGWIDLTLPTQSQIVAFVMNLKEGK